MLEKALPLKKQAVKKLTTLYLTGSYAGTIEFSLVLRKTSIQQLIRIILLSANSTAVMVAITKSGSPHKREDQGSVITAGRDDQAIEELVIPSSSMANAYHAISLDGLDNFYVSGGANNGGGKGSVGGAGNLDYSHSSNYYLKFKRELDSDGDGRANSVDAYPNDPLAW